MSGRPTPLFREVENQIVDFRAWKRRAYRTEHPTYQELAEGIAIADRALTDAGLMAQTCGHVVTCLTGTKGLDSPWAIENWNDHHRIRRLHDPDEDDPQAA